ncbi:N-acetyltransferase, partial [Flavobacteriaceae bacterium]|nr:N-acetyltransferase [Flavobacteriaceae bacterium]
MSEITITNNSFLRQYETTVASSLAKIEYAAQERKIFLTKLIIPSEITQPGFKEDFIIAVLEDIKEQELR